MGAPSRNPQGRDYDPSFGLPADVSKGQSELTITDHDGDVHKLSPQGAARRSHQRPGGEDVVKLRPPTAQGKRITLRTTRSMRERCCDERDASSEGAQAGRGNWPCPPPTATQRSPWREQPQERPSETAGVSELRGAEEARRTQSSRRQRERTKRTRQRERERAPWHRGGEENTVPEEAAGAHQTGRTAEERPTCRPPASPPFET